MENRSSLAALAFGVAALLVGCGASFDSGSSSPTAVGAGGTASGGGAAHGGSGQGGAAHGGAGQGGATGSGGNTASHQGGAGVGGANQGGGSACMPGHVCAPKVPAGWEGPLAYWSGMPPEPPAPCDPGWPTAEVYGVGGLSADPASCSCSCAPAGGSCGPSVVTAWLATQDCVAGGGIDPSEASFQPEKCVAVGTVKGSVRATVPAISVQPTCAGTSPIAKTLPFKWSGVGRICGGAVPGDACGPTSACLPMLGPGAMFCIRAPGTQECSYPEFPQQVVIQTQVTDTRGCQPCTCGEPQSASCTGALGLYSDGACAKPVATVPADGLSCANGTFLSGKVVTSLQAKCGVGTSDPIGDVFTSAPMTLCCQGVP